jgi:hypothetical protein
MGDVVNLSLRALFMGNLCFVQVKGCVCFASLLVWMQDDDDDADVEAASKSFCWCWDTAVPMK